MREAASLSRAVSTPENGALYMRRGTVQVKKSAADDLRVCSEKSPNIAFERDAANSAAPLNLGVRQPIFTVTRKEERMGANLLTVVRNFRIENESFTSSSDD